MLQASQISVLILLFQLGCQQNVINTPTALHFHRVFRNKLIKRHKHSGNLSVFTG